MNDMSRAIIPKSDQLNSDDLIAGPITIQLAGVVIKPGTEQPVSISFAGDNGKPWKPCKSMSRVLVAAWGADASKYAGQSLTLYRDPTVKWAGMEVGGIRISHMTGIDKPLVMALTATKGSRKLFTVHPLEAEKPATASTGLSEAEIKQHLDAMGKAENLTTLKAAYEAAWKRSKEALDVKAKNQFQKAYEANKALLPEGEE